MAGGEWHTLTRKEPGREERPAGFLKLNIIILRTTADGLGHATESRSGVRKIAMLFLVVLLVSLRNTLFILIAA